MILSKAHVPKRTTQYIALGTVMTFIEPSAKH